MSRVAWVLYDPITTDQYFLPVNPYEDNGSHTISKGVLFETTSGLYQDALGNDHIATIAAAGPDNPEPFSYRGRVYTSEEIVALQEWVDKNYPVYLTDDLGRSWMIAIESFELSRSSRSRAHPYKHDYTLTGFILSELEGSIP